MSRLPTFPISAYEHLRPLRPAIRQGPKPDYSTPDKRGWGKPGQPGARKGFVVESVGKNFKLVAMRQLADHAKFVLEGTVALGYPLLGRNDPDGGVGDFVERDIRDTPGVPSWHSWNVAFDINTKANHRSNRWRSTVPPEVVEFWLRSGFDWGGFFRNPYDTHHIEFVGRPEDVPAANAEARRALAEILARREPPEEPVTDPQTLLVQKTYNATLDALGIKATRLVEDGRFGPITEAAFTGLPQLLRQHHTGVKDQLDNLARAGAQTVTDAQQIAALAQGIAGRFGQ